MTAGPGRAAASPPPGRGRRIIFRAATAGSFVSIAAFVFCVIASVDRWHQAVTKPGIAASIVTLIACIAAIHLTGDDE